jgi:hypothetical protein
LLYIKSEATNKTSDKAVEGDNAITEEPPVPPEKQGLTNGLNRHILYTTHENSDYIPHALAGVKWRGPIDRWKKQ